MPRQIPKPITRPVLREIHSRRQTNNNNNQKQDDSNSNKKFKKITLMIPCYNEEQGIGKVIDGLPLDKLKQNNYKIEVLVIDNNCKDNTASIARSKGARVVCAPLQGKGNAIRTGFQSIPQDVDYIVMIDGDDTYKSAEILRLIEPLDNGFCDVIVGSRLEGKIEGHAMSISHRLANWLFTFITRHFYGANVTDTCTGYFAWKASVIRNLNGYIGAKGFAIESEMISKMARLGYQIYSVPITYDPRAGKTKSKLRPFRDALKIIFMLIKNVRWKPKKEE
jgi:glycosyltransferase involved in cell wall biosynthesis